jgi:hypothetical protein
MLAAIVPAQLPAEEEEEALPVPKRARSDAELSPRELAVVSALQAAGSSAVADADSLPAPEALFCALSPAGLQSVLAALALRTPHALRRLLLERLSPAAAELLTARLEEADEQRGGSAGVAGDWFYGALYGAFPDDQQALLTRLLALKDQFATEALHRVIAGVLLPPAVQAFATPGAPG